jgi:hypothetical protein
LALLMLPFLKSEHTLKITARRKSIGHSVYATPSFFKYLDIYCKKCPLRIPQTSKVESTYDSIFQNGGINELDIS